MGRGEERGPLGWIPPPPSAPRAIFKELQQGADWYHRTWGGVGEQTERRNGALFLGQPCLWGGGSKVQKWSRKDG